MFLYTDIIPICDKSKLGLKQIGNKNVKNMQIGDKNKKPKFADEIPNFFRKLGLYIVKLGWFCSQYSCHIAQCRLFLGPSLIGIPIFIFFEIVTKAEFIVLFIKALYLFLLRMISVHNDNCLHLLNIWLEYFETSSILSNL